MVREPGEKERFEVLLEEVRHDFQILADGHIALDERIDRVANESLARDTSMDQKLEHVVQVLSQRLSALDEKTTRLFGGLSERMDAGFAELQTALQSLGNQLNEHVRTH